MRRVCETLLTAAIVLSPLLAATGCVSLAANVMHMIYGHDIKPEFQGLKDQRIAVLCSDANGVCKSDECIRLAGGIRTLVASKLKKATLVPQEEIDGWLRDNSFEREDVPQIGRAVAADYVITVDMQDLKLQDGQTLYRGRADFSVEVYDMSQEKVVFRKTLPDYTYPQTAAISLTEMSTDKFNRLYIAMAAERISRLFIPSPMGADIAADAHLLRY